MAMNTAAVLLEHPDGLVTRIMAWLSLSELGRCMRTCKEWSKRGSDSDELWRGLCAARWGDAKMSEGPWHRRWGTCGSRGEGGGRRVLMACPPTWAFPEHGQEAAENGSGWVQPSELQDVLTWRGSLKASVLDLRRTQITDQELSGSMWALRFRLQPGANTAHVLGRFFQQDRKFVDGAIFPAEMPALWSVQGQSVVIDAPTNPSIRRMTFAVTRLPNWGWHLYSHEYKVEMMSLFDRALVQATAEGVPLAWPCVAADSFLGPDHEVRKEGGKSALMHV